MVVEEEMKQTWWTIRDPDGAVRKNLLEESEYWVWRVMLNCPYVEENKQELIDKGYTAVPIEIEVTENEKVRDTV